MAVNDRDLDTHPDDAKIAALYREAVSGDTPAALDSAVLRNAREAISPREPRLAWWMPWRVPLAFAAVAVLSVSVVLVIEREGGEPLRLEAPPQQAASAPPPPAEPAAPAASAQGPDSAASQAASGATSAAKPEPPQIGRQAADRTDALAKRNAEEGARAERKASADTSSLEKKAEAREKAVLRDAAPAEQARAAAATRGPDVEAAAVAPPAPAPVATPAPAPMAAPPSPAAVLSERAPPVTAQARPAPAPAAKPYIPPAPKPLTAQRRAAELDARDPAVAALIAELDQRPPAEWRERIAALRREDRAAIADALVAEFKRRFPEEPPPPER